MLKTLMFLMFMGGCLQVNAIDPLRQAQESLAAGLGVTRFIEYVQTQNLVNVNATAQTPGGDPYQNRVVVMNSAVDPRTGTMVITPKAVPDQTPFVVEYNPGHPAADPVTGLVKKSNVRREFAQADLNEALVQSQALTQAFENTKSMQYDTIKLLKDTGG